ncbi:hypothetical protein ACG5V6_02885 [Streptomyces chitinivorans]|uniref:Uncharacterized protein n=1 Tax=Streptomyces chitinivorans TaxID=1257027 RepID=A0ABW7HMW9_9ACTN|nr:hypothetical protein [Streptomyces chitinivorans]MDH2408391.1 hypothetical protein [Streptomyces chitinivorans]
MGKQRFFAAGVAAVALAGLGGTVLARSDTGGGTRDGGTDTAR